MRLFVYDAQTALLRKLKIYAMKNNDHIRDFLSYYCDLPKEPRYAVLLSGLWGSGKTWFIKDFVANHLRESERVLYISLYGMQSFDDVESELFRLLHPILGSKSVRLLNKIARGVLKTSINIDIDDDGKSDGTVSANLPTEKILERISLNSKKILVLDDLERCSIPISDIFGYINQFIEHCGIKAILIANEVEIISADEEYKRIKEKLIGRTFEVVPEVSSALEHFAVDLPNENSRKIVQANFPLIAQIYDCSEYRNLRLVRHALWDFDRLIQSLDSSVIKSDLLLKDLLALFLSYSFEVRSGMIKPSEIEKLNDHWGLFFNKQKENPDVDKNLHDIQSKYSALNLYTSLIQPEVWMEIFSVGSIPASKLNESLLKSKYFQDENQSNWVKLWYGFNLNDDDFDDLLKIVEAEWDSRIYKNIGEVIHVVGLLILYAKNGICNRSVEDIILFAKEYIDYLLEHDDIPAIELNHDVSLVDRNSYAGLGFSSMEEQELNDFLNYIVERRSNALLQSLPAKAKDLLYLVDTDAGLFYRRIVLNNDVENIYYKTPILHLINAEDFVRHFLNAKHENKRMVAYAFKERYNFPEFNSKLLPELEWLIQVDRLLSSEIDARAGKVSSMSLKIIVDSYLNNAISQLSDFKSKLIKENNLLPN